MSMEQLVQENIWLIYGGFWAIIVLIIIARALRHRGQIMVRIKYPLGEETIWKKPTKEGQKQTIVMEKKTGKHLGWKFDFDNQCLIPKREWLGLKRYFAVDVFPDSPHACKWDYSLSEVEQPKLTKRDAAEINRLDAFKIRFGKMPKPPAQIVAWITLFVCIGTLILLFLLSQGVRIG